MIANYINTKRLVDTFVELIKVNSPSFQEGALGELLADKLEQAGCSVEFQHYDKSFNLIGCKNGAKHGVPPLILSGHMDTIEPTEGIVFSIDGDAIRTTGSTVLGADDKAALAQIIEVLTVLEERDITHGDLEIVFTSAEEKGLIGAKRLDFSKLRSRHALILDAGGPAGKIIIGAPTQYTYEMKVIGRPAHAGVEPEKGINAIRVASEIIAAIPDGRIDPETTANVGIIGGGTATNVVPKEAIINGEFRSHSAKTLDRLKQTIFDAAFSIAAKHQAQIRIDEQEEYRAFSIGRNDRFLKFLNTVYKKCGISTNHTITGGGSDANVFNQHGIRAINIATGIQRAHSTEEFITLQDLFAGSLIVLQAIMDLKEQGN